MPNQSESGFTQARGSRLELVLRDIEHKQVLFRRTRCWHTALVACELDVPFAPRSADECTVVAVVSRKPTQPLKTQDVNVEAKTCRNLTHRASYSHRKRRKPFSVHDLHCRGEVHPTPMVRVLPDPAIGGTHPTGNGTLRAGGQPGFRASWYENRTVCSNVLSGRQPRIRSERSSSNEGARSPNAWRLRMEVE